jgi:signal transduction histidine kinase
MSAAQAPTNQTLRSWERRPRRAWIAFMMRWQPIILVVLVTLIILFSALAYAPWLAIAAVLANWCYALAKYYVRDNVLLERYTRSSGAKFARSIAMVLVVAIWLGLLYTTTNYLIETEGRDTLWLLFAIAVFIACRQSHTEQIVGILVFASAALVLVTVLGYLSHGVAILGPGALALITKITWLILFTFVVHVFMRYMIDLYSDVKLIGHMQYTLYQVEEKAITSPSAADEKVILDMAVRQIANDFSYEHVNIFLRRNDGAVVCAAGACQAGRELAEKGFALHQDSIVSQVATTGRSYITNDVVNDHHYLKHEAFPRTKAELAVPIRAGGATVGVLDIQTHRRGVFLDQDQEVMEILAGHIADTITNLRMRQSRFRINTIVQTIAARFLTHYDLENTLEAIVQAAQEILGADPVILYEYDGQSKRLTGPVIAGQLLWPDLMGAPVAEPDSLVNRILLADDDHYFHDDVEQASDLKLFTSTELHLRTGRPTFAAREQIQSRAIIRLQTSGVPVGVMFLNFRTPRSFRDSDKEMFFTFADLAALAIQKSRLYQNQLQLEREEIASSLHDHLMGHIYGISQLLLALSHNPDMPPQASQALKTTQDAVQDLRKDARYLHGILKDGHFGDFADEVAKIVRRVENTYQVRCDLRWSGSPHRVPQAQATHLILIMNEAIINSVRHGDPSVVQIDITVANRDVTMSIEDNGHGFDSQRTENASGIANMRIRATRLGGTFDMFSAPGKGTRVVVNLQM